MSSHVPLPNETFHSIFSRLDSVKDLARCCLVSRQFNACVYSLLYERLVGVAAVKSCLRNGFSSWVRSVKLVNDGVEAVDEENGGMLEMGNERRMTPELWGILWRFKGLRTVELVDFNQAALMLPELPASKVTHLKLTYSSESIRPLVQLVRSTPLLESLTLIFSSIRPELLSSVFEAVPSLTSLSLHQDSRLDKDFVDNLYASCPLLQDLRLDSVHITAEAFHTLLQHYGPQLRSLSLSFSAHLPSLSLALLGSHAPRLEHLRISFAPFLDDATVKAIFMGCPLKSLKLRYCGVRDDTLSAAKRYGRMLQTIEFYECNGLKNLNALVGPDPQPVTSDVQGEGSLTRLRVLKLTWCRKLSLSRLASESGRFLKIHTLKLNRCDMLTDEEIRNVVRECEVKLVTSIGRGREVKRGVIQDDRLFWV
ncbi:hypothetical protein HDU85_005401 [Gaertneriomyces sp. JEL0708]|nr:hypothetical protein HDU85_005401 [Gaertneriomyces sp. JEL0708]